MFLSHLPSVLYLLMVTTTVCMTVLRMGRIYINFTPKLPILRNHTGSGSMLDCTIMSHLFYKMICVSLSCQNLLLILSEKCLFWLSFTLSWAGRRRGLLTVPFLRIIGECWIHLITSYFEVPCELWDRSHRCLRVIHGTGPIGVSEHHMGPVP